MVIFFINTDNFNLYQSCFNSVDDTLEIDRDIEVERDQTLKEQYGV